MAKAETEKPKRPPYRRLAREARELIVRLASEKDARKARDDPRLRQRHRLTDEQRRIADLLLTRGGNAAQIATERLRADARARETAR